MQPIGCRVTGLFPARFSRYSTCALLSIGGCVEETTPTCVNPPFAAALRPEAIVSLCSLPGSQKSALKSTHPFET